MFGNKKAETKDDTRELKAMIEGLETERATLKREVNDLQSEKKVKEEEIKHLVKIKDEKREIEYMKKEMALKAEHAEALAKEKSNYQDKYLALLDEAKKDMQKVHSEILERLPNVNAKLSGKL